MPFSRKVLLRSHPAGRQTPHSIKDKYAQGSQCFFFAALMVLWFLKVSCRVFFCHPLPMLGIKRKLDVVGTRAHSRPARKRVLGGWAAGGA